MCLTFTGPWCKKGWGLLPCKVYKNCVQLLCRLWKAQKVIWRRGKVAQPWRYVEESESIDQFQIISLLSVETKIFFDVVAKRLSNFLVSNNYIDTLVQKGGIPGVPGTYRSERVSVLWLSLTNAYETLPHMLVDITLKKHHVPQKVKDLMRDYYSKFSLRVSSGPLTSDWRSPQSLGTWFSRRGRLQTDSASGWENI